MLLSSGVDFQLKDDFQWQNCRNIVIRSLENRDYAAYTTVRYLMANYLERQNLIKEAIVTLLECCYLDSNLTSLNKAIVDRIQEMSDELKVSREEVRYAFMFHNTGVGKVLGLKLSAETSWKEVDTLLPKAL